MKLKIRYLSWTGVKSLLKSYIERALRKIFNKKKIIQDFPDWKKTFNNYSIH